MSFASVLESTRPLCAEGINTDESLKEEKGKLTAFNHLKHAPQVMAGPLNKGGPSGQSPSPLIGPLVDLQNLLRRGISLADL